MQVVLQFVRAVLESRDRERERERAELTTKETASKKAGIAAKKVKVAFLLAEAGAK